MNSYLKKHLNIIIGIFILLGPIIDLLTGVGVHLGYNVTFGIIIRVLFLLLICYSTIFVFKKKKVLIPYSLIGIYCILYSLGIILYKGNIFTEVQGLIKVFYFPIILISMYELKDNIRISKLTLFTVLFTYLLLIFIPTVFNIGFKTYEITKKGTLGFYNSANEISGIISIITPIMLLILKESKKILPKLFFIIMYFIVILMIGTKTPLLSLGITLFFYYIYDFKIKIKKRKYKELFITLSVILFVCISLIIVIPKTNFYKNIKTHLDFLKVDKITDIFKDEELVDHFIFSQRLTFLKEKRSRYLKSNTYQKIFGIGYLLEDGTKEKMIEMDYFDILYSHGLIGLLLYLGVIFTIIYKVFSTKTKYSYSRNLLLTSFFLIVFLSFFTGHIITSPSVSIICIMIIIYLSKKTKKDILFTNKSSLENELELIKEIKKYNVTLLTDTNISNNKISIINIKESNNKLINNSKLLFYKIIYNNTYDLSIYYNKNTNLMKEYAKISSNNSICLKDYSKIDEDILKIEKAINV